jgi:hypothetical protein
MLPFLAFGMEYLVSQEPVASFFMVKVFKSNLFVCGCCAGPPELDIQEQEITSAHFQTVRFINIVLKSV